MTVDILYAEQPFSRIEFLLFGRRMQQLAGAIPISRRFMPRHSAVRETQQGEWRHKPDFGLRPQFEEIIDMTYRIIQFHSRQPVRFGITASMLFALAMFSGCSADSEVDPGEATVVANDVVVEAACGQCQFGMSGEGCDLAVRIRGQSYCVDGTTIDDHGDAHADDGFCNCVREARVTGSVIDDRFKAESFELLPVLGADNEP